MSFELVYSSVEEGLFPGTRGFCVVAATQGIPNELLRRMEALSGYRHKYEPGDPRNPVVAHFTKLTIAGTNYFVLSRVSDAGRDYSGRSNKLAHHIALTQQELLPCGPAEILAHWQQVLPLPSLQPAFLPPRTVACNSQPKASADVWQKYAGDASWARVIAYRLATSPAGAYEWFICPADAEPLLFVRELIGQLPASARWHVTFSTWHVLLPGHVECAMRFVYDGTSEAVKLRSDGVKKVTDLCLSLGKAPLFTPSLPILTGVSRDHPPIDQPTSVSLPSGSGTHGQEGVRNDVELPWCGQIGVAADSSSNVLVSHPIGVPSSDFFYRVPHTLPTTMAGGHVSSGIPVIPPPFTAADAIANRSNQLTPGAADQRTSRESLYAFTEVALYCAALVFLLSLLVTMMIIYGPSVLTLAQGGRESFAKKHAERRWSQNDTAAGNSSSQQSDNPSADQTRSDDATGQPPKSESPDVNSAGAAKSDNQANDQPIPHAAAQAEVPNANKTGHQQQGQPEDQACAPGERQQGDSGAPAPTSGLPEVDDKKSWHPMLPSPNGDRVCTWDTWDNNVEGDNKQLDNVMSVVFPGFKKIGQLQVVPFCLHCGSPKAQQLTKIENTRQVRNVKLCNSCYKPVMLFIIRRIEREKRRTYSQEDLETYILWLGLILDRTLLLDELNYSSLRLKRWLALILDRTLLLDELNHSSLRLKRVEKEKAEQRTEVRVGRVVDLRTLIENSDLQIKQSNIEITYTIHVRCGKEYHFDPQEKVILYKDKRWRVALKEDNKEDKNDTSYALNGTPHMLVFVSIEQPQPASGQGNESRTKNASSTSEQKNGGETNVGQLELPDCELGVRATIKWREHKDRRDDSGEEMNLSFWLPIESTGKN